MEENRDEKGAATERGGPQPLNLDFLRRERRPEPAKSRKPLVVGGLVLALALMLAGTLVSTLAPRPWKPVGLYLFLAAAVLYLVCRSISIGLFNTTPKVFAILLLLGGCFALSKWPLLSPLGILGAACLATSLLLILLYGLGYVGRRDEKRQDTP
jgi:hypothetical protein